MQVPVKSECWRMAGAAFAASALFALGMHAATGATASTLTGQPNQRGYFISVDGLNPLHLQTLLDRGKLTAPHGFRWLKDHTTHIQQLEPIYTSLTAPSHISTITCSPPSKHGIIANNYLTSGQRVSGFTTEFRTEALWEAARRQGKKVVSLAYVGADGTSSKRTVDYGLAYPQERYNSRSQTLDWQVSTLAAASDWTAADTLDLSTARQQTVEIRVNPTTSETVSLQALIVIPAAMEPEIYLDDDKNLTNGYVGKLQRGNTQLPEYVHYFFTENDALSPLQGYRRTVFLRTLPSDAGHISLYVSGSSYNNAHPAAYRQALDAAGLVWPNYGIGSDRLTPLEKIDSQALFDRFLTRVAAFTKANFEYDIVLFYQPLIDTLGHSYEGRLPLPFNPDATDEISQAYVKAFQIIDQNLSDLLSDTATQDIIAVMGDHGMDPIKKTVNVAALLPQPLRDQIDIVSSGTLILLYPKRSSAAPKSATSTVDADAVGQEIYERLKDLKFEDQPVFGMAQRFANRAIYGAEQPQAYGGEWQFGDALWAFTGATGYWLRYNEIDANIFADPPAFGMHGNFINIATMDTTGFIGGPRRRGATIARDKLLNIVPTFSMLLGMTAPTDCMGVAIEGMK